MFGNLLKIHRPSTGLGVCESVEMDLTWATKLDNREHREELLPRLLRHLSRTRSSSVFYLAASGREPENNKKRRRAINPTSTTTTETESTRDESSRPSLVSIVIIFDYVNNRFLRRHGVLLRGANRSSTSFPSRDRVRRSRCKQLLLLLLPLGGHFFVRAAEFFGLITGDVPLTQTDVDDHGEARDSFRRIRDHAGSDRPGKDAKQVFRMGASSLVDLSKSEPGPASRTNLIYTNRSFDMLIVSRLATT